MPQWQTVAEGTNIGDLELMVEDMYLPKGARIRAVFDTWAPWAFDAAGVELAFQPFIPDGLDLVDVWGEGDHGIVEMEVDPAWLVAVFAFIKAHWLAVIIAGFVLVILISFVRLMVKLPAAAQIPVWLLIGAAAGIVGLVIIGARSPPVRRET